MPAKIATIAVAQAFSRYPAGRYETDGPFSGEVFRARHLMPALQAATQDDGTVRVQLDGTMGYGSSFLEEAFGGLVRAGFEKHWLKEHLKVISRDLSLVEEIEAYIGEAVVEDKKA